MSPNVKITDWELRQAKGQCGADGCPREAVLGSAYCEPCGAAKKARDRKWIASRRKERRAKRECVSCGRRSKTYRCARCAKPKESVGGSKRSVGGLVRRSRPARGHYKSETFADGATRSRYVGLSHRGGPTREEQDASLVKLVLGAVKLTQDFLEAFPSERAAIDSLPRIQRAEAWELLVSRLTRSARLQLEVAGALAKTWSEICAGCGRAHDADDEAEG